MRNFLKFFGREISRDVVVVVAVAGIAVFAFAFTEPSVGPTGGTVNAPINTSGILQTKTGSFTSGGTVTGNILNALSSLSLAGTSGITKVVSQITGPLGAVTTNGANVILNGAGVTQSGNTFTFSGGGGVSQIIAGTNVTISPSGGTGAVTINASGGVATPNLQQVTDIGFVTTQPLRSINVVSGSGQVMVGVDENSRRLLINYNGLFDFASIQGGVWGGTTRPVVLNGGGGNVGIGTIAPGAKLEVAGQVKITGGSPGTGKVLTSDAGGLASWATPSSSGGQYDNLNWIVATRVDAAGLPIGSSVVAPIPNGWTIATVQSWMRGLAAGFSWSIIYDHLALSPTSVTVPDGKWCDAVPPALPTNRPCHYYSETTGTDLGSWANNGTGILVTTAKKLGIGTTNPGAGLEVKTDVVPLKLWNTASGAGYWLVGPNNSNAFQVINQNNTGMYMTNGATSWTATSDGRLKENVSPINGALQKVLHMRGVTYNFKDNSRRELGVIAQEVQPYFPELVTVGPDTEYLGVSYDRIAPVLIEAIKEQQKEIDSLKARIEALEKK